MNNCFIFTEAYNCSDILKNCLKSFFTYHDDVIHVFGTKKDLQELEEFTKIIPIIIEEDSDIAQAYNFGHLGTAKIFSKAILEYSNSDKIIHFDSDIIFKQKCLDKIKEKLNEGYDLVGPVRPYKHNLNSRDDVRHMPDVSATCFFGFNKSKINITNPDELMYSINGRNFKNNPILDFFDYVSLTILDNNGKFYKFDFNDTGGPNELGNKMNKYGMLNDDLDCGDWYIHFAGIGSGSKLYKLGIKNTHRGYAEWAIGRYGLYKKLIENIDLPYINIDMKKYLFYKSSLNIKETNNL
jgi:hypothetical protein